jgi:hypothetical protein
MVYVVLVSQYPFLIPGFPALLFRRRARRRQKKRKAMINTKERLLSFFSPRTPHHHAWSFWTPNMDRGIGGEREYDRKRKKTLTNLARFGIQYTNMKLTV